MWRNAVRGGAAVTMLMGLAACGPSGGSASHGTTIPGVRSSSQAATGGGSTKANALDVLDVVAKRTSSVHSVKVDGTMSVGSSMSVTSKGEIDWSHGFVSTMTSSFDGGTAAQTMKNAGVTGPIQARYLPDGFYMNMGPVMAAHLGGKHWIRYPFAELAKIGSGGGAFLKDQAQNNNPARAVQSILASKDVRKIGAETVRGIRTVHYAGTVDAAEMTGRASRYLTAAQLTEMRRVLKNAGINREKVDLWIGADHHPVKADSSAETKNGEMTSTVYYSDFGLPVHVTAPPASDCVDFSSMFKAAGKNA